jgi:uncharacterized membrane protein YccC
VFCAAVAAFACDFFLLQSIDGFPLFALALGVFLVPVSLMGLNPRTAGFATAFCVYFMILTQPFNAMVYDVVSFLNNSMAVVVGVVFGVLAYQLILPPDLAAARRYIARRIGHGLRALALRIPIPPAWQWQTRMFDRVNRLHETANPSGTEANRWFESGLAVLNLGNELLILRQLLEAGKFSHKTSGLLHSVIASFASVSSQSSITASTVQAAEARLARMPAPEEGEDRRAWFRARGILEEMKVCFLEYPNFLDSA